MSYIVKANFIDEFKIGDNINFNLEILKILYEQYEKIDNKRPLIKPIVILNTSIAEAILYDFVRNRVKYPNRKEIIFPNFINLFRSKKLDRFEHYIEQAKKYNFFKTKDTKFYDNMHDLRKRRNRIHIQNDKGEKPLDELDVFDEKIKILSERVVDKILNTMSTHYPRPEEYHRYVRDFVIPWNRHFNT